MFLFSHKTKTPISTYTDSYRAPANIKEVHKDPPLWAWEANKFVTPGLTHAMHRHLDPETLQKMAKCAPGGFSYRRSISGHPYFPEKYWLSQEEDEKCCPSYLDSDGYDTWRTEAYSPCWNKYTTCLPRLSKEARMDTVGRGLPLEYPPKQERPNAYERDVVVNMLNSLSRDKQLPQITSRCGCVDPLQGRLPFQGYQSPCSGRHYCLRGMDYCTSTCRPLSPERRLRPPCLVQPTVRCALPYDHRPGMQCDFITPPPSYYPYPNLRWDTSHFKKTGGLQRNNYVVHPEFVSESYPDYRCW